MKKVKYLLYTLIALLPVVSGCRNKEEYTPGEKDLENCYGVYFESMESTHFVLAPEEPARITFNVLRDLERGDEAIEVPAVLKTNDVEVLSLGLIKFEKAEEKTTVDVFFPKAEIGKTYNGSIVIEDPQYALTYGTTRSSVSFDVIRVKWNELGEGWWRDDLIGPFSDKPTCIPEYKVQVAERDDLPGYFRVSNVYYLDFLVAFYENAYSAEELAGYIASGDLSIGNPDIFIDATDPENVKIEPQEIGFQYYSNGVFSIGGPWGEYGEAGTYDEETGIIEWPVEGIMVGFGASPFDYGNTSGKTRLVLPEHERPLEMDYSLKILNGYSDAEGVMQMMVTMGEDVESAKYAIYEGTIPGDELDAAYANFDKDPAAKVTDGSVMDITLDKTGPYTAIAKGYVGEDIVAKTYAYFNYVAAGDNTKHVKLNAGLIVSDKYLTEGNTSENSMEYYISGTDITEVYAEMFKTEDYDANPDECVDYLLYETEPFASADLKKINSGVLSGVIEDLDPGTEYTFLVYASNSYSDTVAVCQSITGGEPDPLVAKYTSADLAQYVSKDEFFATDWRYLACITDDEGAFMKKRTEIGSVKFSEEEDELDDDGSVATDVIKATGFTAPWAAKFGFNDTMYWEYYRGLIYNLANTLGTGAVPYYFAMESLFSMGGRSTFGLMDSMIYGAYVNEGLIAFVDSGAYASYGAAGEGLCLSVYKDDTYGDDAYFQWIEKFSQMILADPAVYPAPAQEGEGGAQGSSLAPSGLKSVAKEMAKTRTNFVETDRGYIHSTIDKIMSSKRVSGRGSFGRTWLSENAFRNASFTVRPSSATTVNRKVDISFKPTYREK
ncbi:MAG: hypothetical protein IJM35_05455 [Bacteroidales bacterium]|nr:hypothetical protein [Bacteroidales bacterium]